MTLELDNPHRPLVSVLLLTYNHERYIRECLESIAADNYKNVEVICVDNGSTDGTFRELQAAKADMDIELTVVRNEVGRLVNAAMNQTIPLSRGSLVIFFSGDDIFIPHRIERQVGYFLEKPELRILYANCRYLGGSWDGQQCHEAASIMPHFEKEPQDLLRFIFKNRGLLLQTAMIKRDLLTETGGHDEASRSDDWIANIRMIGRMTSRRQYAFVNEDVCIYRRHDSNITHDFPRQSAAMIETIDKYYRLPDRRQELADIYWLQVRAGFATYKLQYVRLVTYYFLKSMQYDFKVGRIFQYFRLLCIADLRSYRMLRPVYVFLRGIWRNIKKNRVQA